jgi:hypothetical protein
VSEYISIIDLANDERIFIDGKPRDHRAIITLLKRRFKIIPVLAYFPDSKYKGKAVSAITRDQAEEIIRKLNSVEVVQPDTEQKPND